MSISESDFGKTLAFARTVFDTLNEYPPIHVQNTDILKPDLDFIREDYVSATYRLADALFASRDSKIPRPLVNTGAVLGNRFIDLAEKQLLLPVYSKLPYADTRIAAAVAAVQTNRSGTVEEFEKAVEVITILEKRGTWNGDPSAPSLAAAMAFGYVLEDFEFEIFDVSENTAVAHSIYLYSDGKSLIVDGSVPLADLTLIPRQRTAIVQNRFERVNLTTNSRWAKTADADPKYLTGKFRSKGLKEADTEKMHQDIEDFLDAQDKRIKKLVNEILDERYFRF